MSIFLACVNILITLKDNYIFFLGETFAQRTTKTCRHGNESRYSWKAEGHDVSQNLYTKTWERQVRRADAMVRERITAT